MNEELFAMLMELGVDLDTFMNVLDKVLWGNAYNFYFDDVRGHGSFELSSDSRDKYEYWIDRFLHFTLQIPYSEA